MTRLHRMNLKGPWDYEWLEGPIPVEGTASLNGTPCTEQGADEAMSGNEFLLAHSRVRMPSSIEDAWGRVTGRVRFRRRFQKPTNLDEHERVHIAFDGLGGRAAVSLNGEPLAELCDVASTQTIDVTDRIGPSNVLSLELTRDAADPTAEKGGLWGAVAIEIHDAGPGE